MAVATSCPEFFVNVISTFVTESDMGLGTIVGSALFNTLGVGALGGLAASKVIAINISLHYRLLMYLYAIVFELISCHLYYSSSKVCASY